MFAFAEAEKYDLEHVVKVRDIEVKEVLDQVQNCRGKLYDCMLHRLYHTLSFPDSSFPSLLMLCRLFLPGSEKPPLKKVSNMANQLEKIKLFAARASQANYRASLKQVAKKEYTLEDDEKTKKVEKPEWAERSNKNIPRLSTSASEPVSGAVSEIEDEEDEE